MEKIFYTPTKPFYVGQPFGANKVCVSLIDNEEFIFCDGWNPPTGYRSVYGSKGHLGIDIPLPRWKPIVSMREGYVYDIDTNKKSGYDVRIRYEIDGSTYYVVCEHMVKWNVKIGDTVVTGQLIGWVGSTGKSTGPHLHLQIQDADGNFIDPMLLIDTTTYAGDVFKQHNRLQHAVQQVKILQGQFAIFFGKG